MHVDPNGRVKLADFGMAKHVSTPYVNFLREQSTEWLNDVN